MVREGSARDVVRLALQVDRSQFRPLIGIESACAIGIPLAIGLAVNHPRAGAWAAIGAFLSSFSLFQPGFRIRARVVVVAAVIVGVGVFLGAITGILHPGIYPVVAGWTFLGGMLVAVSPNAAMVGVVSSVGLMIASSLNATPALALEDGGLALCGGLGAAVLVLVFHRHGQRAEARALAGAFGVLADYAAGIGRGKHDLPEADSFDALSATLALPGPHRYLDHAARDRALAVQAEELRTSLAALSEARDRLIRERNDRPGAAPTIERIDWAGAIAAAVLGAIADLCAADRHAAAPGPTDPRLAGLDRIALRPTATQPAASPAAAPPAARSQTAASQTAGSQTAGSQTAGSQSTAPTAAGPAPDPHDVAEVDDHLDEIVSHLRTARDLLDTALPVHGSHARRQSSAAGANAANGTDAAPGAPVPPPTERQGPLAGATLALRANLTLRSTACRHALRLAAVSTVATLLYRVIDPVDGYWIVVAVIFVLKPEFGMTVGRSLLRVTGTLAGVAVATLVLASLQPGPVVLAVLAVVVSAFLYSFFNVNYGAFAVFLTCLTVFLAAFMGLPPMTAVANRTVDNLIGSGLTVVAFLVWPTWVATEVPRLVATCLRTQGRFGQIVVGALADPGRGSEGEIDQSISAARLSRSNAEAAVERMAHEPYGADKGTLALDAAEDMLSQMHRFGLAGLALRHHLTGNHRDRIGALEPLGHQLETSFESLAKSVEADVPCPPSGLGPVGEQVHRQLDDRLLHTIVKDETDLMVHVVDTTVEIYNDSRGATRRRAEHPG